jgi:hypothetical protein
LLLVASPPAASAIQLHWSSGADTLSFATATRCVLLLRADSAEAALPAEWRLMWLADSSGVRFLSEDSTDACVADTARVSRYDAPSTRADSAGRQLTAHFCSADGPPARTAYFVLDQPGGSRGRLKIVALDPADPDSNRIIESNEVTYNGGVVGDYAPLILRVTSDHSTTTLRVEAIGADLAGVRAVSISAPGLQTDVPLAVGSSGPSSVVASATIAIPLPNSAVLIGTPEGVLYSGEIPADIVEATEVPDEAYYRDPAYPAAYPKDFAFINAPTPVDGVWRNQFHIFYIRSWRDGRPDSTNEVAFGHAWSRDLINWEHTANSLDAFHADTSDVSAWDHLHVWAPSIVQFGTKFLMFYTGVAENGDQTIGYASADSIYTTSPSSAWSRQTMYSHSPPQAEGSWVSVNHPWQFRDPFVMADPQNPTSRLLMFYTAKTATDSGYAVGVARSALNNAAWWDDLGFYPTTDYAHTFIKRLESPHVFPDSTNWAPERDLFATWRIMFTMGDWDFPDSTRIVFFDTKVTGTDVTDRTASHWSTTPTNLYDYLHLTSESPEYGHQATEMLNIGGNYFWAGFDGTDIRFRRAIWGGTNQFWLTNVGQIVGVQGQGAPKTLRLAIAGLSPSRGVTQFRIDMPARMRISLVLYDVMGRRVRSLVDHEITPGSTEVTWDGRNQSGTAVGTGMYFARMVAGGTSYVVRVPLVR